MTGGYIFSLSTLVGGGGTPSQVWVGGYPTPGLGRGYLEYPPLTRSGWGTPLDLGWGTPGTGSPQTWDRYPSPLDLGPGTPQTWDGVPPHDRVPPDLGSGTPPDLGPGTPPTWHWVPPKTWDWVPPPDQVRIRQSSTASTCYAAGGVPLAFTQEDILVFICTNF